METLLAYFEGENGNSIIIIDTASKFVFTEPMTAFHHLVINSSATANDSLTIDFSIGGNFNIGYGIVFNGSTSRTETLGN